MRRLAILIGILIIPGAYSTASPWVTDPIGDERVMIGQTDSFGAQIPCRDAGVDILGGFAAANVTHLSAALSLSDLASHAHCAGVEAPVVGTIFEPIHEEPVTSYRITLANLDTEATIREVVFERGSLPNAGPTPGRAYLVRGDGVHMHPTKDASFTDGNTIHWDLPRTGAARLGNGATVQYTLAGEFEARGTSEARYLGVTTPSNVWSDDVTDLGRIDI